MPLVGILSLLSIIIACDHAAGQASDSRPENGGAASEPYLVFVAEAAAHLRCGPSGEDYRTDPLRHGQELEVYVETSDGWLGVRPVEESFCWIPADAVELTAAVKPSGFSKTSRSVQSGDRATEGEIIENKTVAWIGTNLGRARRYRWQVQLGEGEIVTILGSSEREGPDGPQAWYRIVPPSGEFRWIHRDQVVTTAEALIDGLKTVASDQPIEFLPVGPTRVSSVVPTMSADAKLTSDFNQEAHSERRSQPTKMKTKSISPVRFEILRPEGSQGDDELAVDEIERNIEKRSRYLAGDELARGTVRQQPDESDRVSDPTSEPEPASHSDHPIRDFSERVSEGISVLMRGRDPNEPNLQPMTRSSRRDPELVPIGSGLANSSRPISANKDDESIDIATTSVPRKIGPLASRGGDQPGAIQSDASAAQPLSATIPAASPAKVIDVAASSHPGLISNQSQVAILSAPRLVSPIDSSVDPSGYDAEAIHELSGTRPVVSMPRPRMRTITAAQYESVQRSVAEATPASLSAVLSNLMARGASAPEMALVAQAAAKMGVTEMARRASEYEALARRRDGETVIATQHLGTPQAVPQLANSQPTSWQPLLAGVPGGRIATPETAPQVPAVPQVPFKPHAIAPASFANAQGPIENESPIATSPETVSDEFASGVLVEVYSADPNRPPYAITDRGGRTLAYVTPAPGVDVKRHLGSEVRLSGESGFLQGLDTPHILATAATRLVR